MASSRQNKKEKCHPCGHCINVRTILEGVHAHMARLMDLMDTSPSTSVLKNLRKGIKDAQHATRMLHPHQDQGPGTQTTADQEQTIQDQDPPEAGRGCVCKTASQEGRFPSGGAFGIGRAGFWVMAASQESEPEGAGGRATHRHGRRPPLQQGPDQDFSTARVNRPMPPLMLHHFSDAKEEIEKVE